MTQEQILWPVGIKHIETGELVKHLRQRASWHAKRALRLWNSDTTDELLTSAIGVGCSIELLAKAALAHISPALLIEQKDDNYQKAMAVLLGVQHRQQGTVPAPEDIRTITAENSVAALTRHIDGFTWTAQDKVVFAVRNAAMHMGLVNPNTLHDANTRMVALADRILSFMDVERELYYGDTTTLADSLTESHAKTITNRLKRKRDVSAAVIERKRMAAVDFYEELQAWRNPTDTYGYELGKCPFCREMGYVRYVVSHDRDVIDEPEIGYHELFFIIQQAVGFQCVACETNLDSDELARFPDINGDLLRQTFPS